MGKFTADSASHIPAGNVLVSLTAFTVIYILLLIAYLYLVAALSAEVQNLTYLCRE